MDETTVQVAEGTDRGRHRRAWAYVSCYSWIPASAGMSDEGIPACATVKHHRTCGLGKRAESVVRGAR
jgi:hypothetical protein